MSCDTTLPPTHFSSGGRGCTRDPSFFFLLFLYCRAVETCSTGCTPGHTPGHPSGVGDCLVHMGRIKWISTVCIDGGSSEENLEAGPSRVTHGDDCSVPAGRDEALGPALQVRRRDLSTKHVGSGAAVIVLEQRPDRQGTGLRCPATNCVLIPPDLCQRE